MRLGETKTYKNFTRRTLGAAEPLPAGAGGHCDTQHVGSVLGAERGVDGARRAWLAGGLLGTLGLLAHNWWVVIYPIGWMPSFDALISEASATDQPHGWLLSGIDIGVGVALVAALFLCRRTWLQHGRASVWWWSLVWALGGLVEGVFPLACSPSTNRTCEDAEWAFELAAHHYVHMAAGVVEFVAASIAILLVWRTPALGWLSRLGAWLSLGILVVYPFLGLAFFTHRLSSIPEAVFFVMFSSAMGAVVWWRPSQSG